MKRFENKVAVITGASRGIGQSILTTLSREGARVFALGISDYTETAKKSRGEDRDR